jgi:hypothetical protein
VGLTVDVYHLWASQGVGGIAHAQVAAVIMESLARQIRCRRRALSRPTRHAILSEHCKSETLFPFRHVIVPVHHRKNESAQAHDRVADEVVSQQTGCLGVAVNDL